MKKTAILSPDERYRYVLTREWAVTQTAVFILLNPSTADGAVDDPTIRRCIGFSRQWHCGKLVVLNLYAYRTTNRADLFRQQDPVGPENDKFILEELHPDTYDIKPLVICGWGSHPKIEERASEMLALLKSLGHRAFALRLTQHDRPEHPLYVPYDLKPVRIV